MKSIFLKIIVNFLIIVVMVNGFIFPLKAYAMPVFDAPVLGSTVGQILTDIGQWLKEDAQDGIIDTVRKRLLDEITRRTVEWIQGGGEPKFVDNWDDFLKTAGNLAFDGVMEDVRLAWLCEPIKLQVQLSFFQERTFSQQIDCTLDEVTENIEDFYRDFNKGGWIAYSEAWQPQNNFFGQIFIINDEITRRTADAINAAKNEAITSRGFLSVRRCKGGGISSAQAGAMDTRGLVMDKDGNYCLPKDMEIVTPGTAVGDAVASAIRSDADWAKDVRSMSATIVDALVSQFLKEGIALIGSGNDEQELERQELERQLLEEQRFTIQQTEQSSNIQNIENIVKNLERTYKLKPEKISYAQKIKEVLPYINWVAKDELNIGNFEITVEIANEIRQILTIGPIPAMIFGDACSNKEFENFLRHFQIPEIRNNEAIFNIILEKTEDRKIEIEDDIIRLNNQMTKMRDMIDRGNVLITEIEGATMPISHQITQRFVDFITEYSNFMREDGVLFQSAKQERDDLEKEYWDLYKIIEDCS